MRQRLWTWALPALALWLSTAGCGEPEAHWSARASELQPTLSSLDFELLLDNGDAATVYLPTGPGPESADERLPVVVHLQGGSVDAQHYAGFGRTLAQAGFAVIVPNHLRVLGAPGSPPSPLTEGQVVAAALRGLSRAAEPAGSFLRARIDLDRIAVTGHSFGGVVGLYTVAGLCMAPFCTPPLLRPPLRAAAFFGTHLVRDGKAEVPAMQGVPVALLAGLQDGRALPDQIRATYDRLSGPRSLIRIDGVNHYGITDSNPPAGATPETRTQTREQGQGVRLIARAVAAFLAPYLRHVPPTPLD